MACVSMQVSYWRWDVEKLMSSHDMQIPAAYSVKIHATMFCEGPDKWKKCC